MTVFFKEVIRGLPSRGYFPKTLTALLVFGLLAFLPTARLSAAQIAPAGAVVPASTTDPGMLSNYRKGMSAYQARDYRNAAHYLKLALTIQDPNVEKAYYASANAVLGVIYEYYGATSGHLDIARKYYRSALQIDPANDTAKKHLKMIETDESDLVSAAGSAAPAVQLDNKTLLTGDIDAELKRQEVGAGSDSWYIGIGGGISVPVCNWNPDFYIGGYGNLFAGRQLSRNFALQLSAEQAYFTGGYLTINNPRFLGELKFTFDSSGFQPYLLGGAGIDLQFSSLSGESAMNFDAMGGLGCQFEMGTGKYLYVEAHFNVIATQSVVLQDVPVVAGLLLML
jgi:tetratricopeptide (TPR) repeat protein